MCILCADVAKLGVNQRNQFGSPNPMFSSKFQTQQYGQPYQPLHQNQVYQSQQQPSHLVQNQTYQRNTSHYATTAQLQYQGYNGSLNDINQSPYHHGAAPPQPPNYQETINNLYHRQQHEQNHYQSKDQLSKFANVSKLQSQGGHPYSSYAAYSCETSPVNQPYGYAPHQLNGGLSNYHNYDIDGDYLREDYKQSLQDEYGVYGKQSADDYGIYGPCNGLDHSQDNLQYSDPDLALVKVRSHK